MTDINYTPSGRVLTQFHNSATPIRVLNGPLGSGKTTACCFEVLVKAMAQAPNKAGIRKTRWLVVRSTYPELMSTTIASWRSWFGPEMGDMKIAPPVEHKLRFQMPDQTYVECDVIFMALDGPDADAKIRGLEITGAWFNECREIPKPIWDMVDGRIGRYPSKRDGGPTWHGVIADTNPPDDESFLYRFAEIDRPKTWEFFRQPGGVVKRGNQWVLNPMADNLDNLPPNYYSRMLSGKGEDWIRVYLAGEYGYIVEGKPVFPEYSDSAHTADLKPVKELPLHIGADFGLTPAAVIAQRGAMGQLYIIDELIAEDVGAVKFGEALKRLLSEKYAGYRIETMTGDPAGSVRAPTDEQTVFQILNAQGLKFRPASSNLMTIRREAVARPLTRFIDGAPGFLVNRRCQKLRGGLGGKFCYKRMKVSGERYNETPDKNEWSHVCDALQYLCLGMGEGQAILRLDAADRKRPTVISGTKRAVKAGTARRRRNHRPARFG